MESNNKLISPSGNVQDIKYLYTVIAALKRKGGRVESNEMTFENLINEYNEAKASKQGLTFKPREVNVRVVENIITELKSLKIIRKEGEYLVLTDEGEKIASLIEKRESKGLKTCFIKLMMDNFTIFEHFLKRLKEIPFGVPIPFITSDVFDRCEGNTKKIADNYINLLNKYCSYLIIEPKKLYDLLDSVNINSLKNKTEKIDKLQSVIEKFIVSEAFGPIIKSRRTYDFVRSRTTFLELSNYATFDFDGSPAEITYLISDFKSTFEYFTEIVNYSGGNLYLNKPDFEKIKECLKESITKVYNTYKDDVGYVKIADVRDKVCRELRISDELFDEYLKNLYKDEPNWISFTYSGAGERITEKRSPIIFEKPMREFFTLLKINERR